MRYAILRTTRDTVSTVKAYLPENYKVVSIDEDGYIIMGMDNAGWTLDDYVLPRLASGNIFGEEISEDEAEMRIIHS